MRSMKWFSALAATLVCSSALAAYTPNRFITLQYPTQPGYGTLTTVGAGAAVQIYPPAGPSYITTNGSLCSGGFTSNDDSVAHSLFFYIYDASSNLVAEWAMYTIPHAGFGIPAQPILNSANVPGIPVDQNGNPTIAIPAGGTLKAAFLTALVSSAIYVHLDCGGF